MYYILNTHHVYSIEILYCSFTYRHIVSVTHLDCSINYSQLCKEKSPTHFIRWASMEAQNNKVLGIFTRLLNRQTSNTIIMTETPCMTVHPCWVIVRFHPPGRTLGFPLVNKVRVEYLCNETHIHSHTTCHHTTTSSHPCRLAAENHHTRTHTLTPPQPTYIKLISLHNLRWWVVMVVMCLVVLVPLISLEAAEG